MAKEKEKQLSARDKRLAEIAQTAQGMTDDVGVLGAERQIEEQREQFNQRVQKLEELTLRMIDKHGEEYYMSQLLMTFLDVNIQMQETLETMSAIGQAMNTITEAMTCMDTIMTTTREAMNNTTRQNYGFFARRKYKREMRQVIRNQEGRMMQMADMLEMGQDVAMTTAESMQRAAIRTQQRTARNAERQKRRQAKLQKSSGGAPVEINSLAKQRLAQLRAERTGSGTTATTTTTGAAPVDTPAAPTGGTGSYDDLM